MMTAGINFRKALLLSLVFHFMFLLVIGGRFHARRINYWAATPVELVNIPGPVTGTAPVEGVKANEFKKEVIPKPVTDKNKITIKGKEKTKIKAKAKEKTRETVKEVPKFAAQTVNETKPAPANETKASGQAGTGTGPATAGATAAATIDTEFPYPYYLNIVTAQVESNWDAKKRQGIASHKVTVFFTIGREGEISNLSVEKSSGVDFYDQLALRAIILCKQFPPLPEEYKEPVLRIHYNFTYTNKEE